MGGLSYGTTLYFIYHVRLTYKMAFNQLATISRENGQSRFDLTYLHFAITEYKLSWIIATPWLIHVGRTFAVIFTVILP